MRIYLQSRDSFPVKLHPDLPVTVEVLRDPNREVSGDSVLPVTGDGQVKQLTLDLLWTVCLVWQSHEGRLGEKRGGRGEEAEAGGGGGGGE